MNAAKKTIERAPVATPQTNEVVRRVIRCLDQSRVKTHFSTAEHFRRAVQIWEAALRRAEMDEWLDLCQGMERGLDPLAEALHHLLAHAVWSYEDVPGLVYMTLNLGDIRKGQYFTPFAVARMMAEELLRDFRPPAPGKGPVRIHEPACGSGVMLLAAMEVLDERFPGLLDRGDVVFSGMDNDATCVAMCSVNMRLRAVMRGPRRLMSEQEKTQDREPAAAISLPTHSDKPEATPVLPILPDAPPTTIIQYTFF